MRNQALTIAALGLAACFTATGTPDTAYAQNASIETHTQFLINSAATDFHKHPKPFPERFRNVRIGHVATPTGKQYRMCGQFLPRQDGGKAEWLQFATIQTSDYEQYVGGQSAIFCKGEGFKWDDVADLSTSLQQRLDALQSQAADTFASREITVTTRGTGPDVILIHGLGSNIGAWAETAETLDDRYRLHLVQIHGFGGMPRTSTDSLLPAVAREVARYARESGLTGPAVIGHSMGGTIALMIAARNPGLAGRVMVVDMVPFMGVMFGQPDATAEALRPMAEQMRAQILNSDMLNQMVATMTRSEANRQKVLQSAKASDRNVVANAMHDLILTDLRPELPRLALPLTVLYVQPAAVPVPAEQFDAAMKQTYSAAPNVTMVRIDESNHYIQLDQPARFVAEVDAFMRR
jgi:pimeloyl-ACP methyl ester carboxylesterase